MLKENSNHETIKEKVKKKLERVESLTYSSLVDP